MCSSFKFIFTFHSLIYIFCLNYLAVATLVPLLEPPLQQTVIVNAFTGCNIRVLNFKGLNIDFQEVQEPILLLRYLSHCKKRLLFPFELASKYPALSMNDSLTCNNAMADQTNLPSDEIAISYSAQTLSESFQTRSKNKICEVDIYIHPPTERNSPHMYMKHLYWQSVLKNPTFINLAATSEMQKWKNDYFNSVPMVSLLICDLTANSICGNQNDVNKWTAGIFYEFQMVTLSVNVLIWKYPSLSLETLCPYCDPCDSFKTISLGGKVIPTSRKELENVLKETQHLNSNPHSVQVLLLENGGQLRVLRNPKAVLKYIQMYPNNLDLIYIYLSADQHLISLLLPKSANITFGDSTIIFKKDDSRNYYAKWKKIIVDACSPTKGINSHPIFRPIIIFYVSRSPIFFQENRLVTFILQYRFVSCHKEQLHWTSQLKELISPFDLTTWFLILTICFTVSWIVKLSNNSHSHSQNRSLCAVTFTIFWSILDQSNSLFQTHGIALKCSFYWCVFSVPLTWLYLSTLYKGENVTRLTAEPPLIPFDTFKMLEEFQFTTYSRRINLKTTNSEVFNITELVKLNKKYGSVSTHEAFPVVSELWQELMFLFRPVGEVQLGLNFLKDEIPKQIWKYIENSAMMPDCGQKFQEEVSSILNIHMSKCNKSAIILRRSEALKLHILLKRMGKPSFFGKDKILESFNGYKFVGHFPTHIIFRARYIFEAGILKRWQKMFEYSLVLKTTDYANKLVVKTNNQNETSEIGGCQTAVVILSLIPGVGLLISLIIFSCAEIPIQTALQKHVLKVLTNLFSTAKRRFLDIRRVGFKSQAPEQNVISIYVQPKII